ncbi:hypothetical protein LCM01_20590 [Bacillus thuringiensis]|uniref:hypothetical protein n=1 Tax=Bacillus thuringiensis TaxID=1428 RepID=UPI001CD6E96F|nr:hypothetical protein [Bacillus thuringiensis]MCA1002800.1 hypothetical protein [Bacillus thuringiensis]
MKKNCIFCGEKVTDKSKEHIIPQWLMRLTGDPNRQIQLGINFPKKDKWPTNPDSFVRKFSFNSFQFPACSKCNSDFSELESNTKPVIEKILNKEAINIGEIDTLLDWFDKIRIGLWLGYYFLNNNITQINPQFAIGKRLGAKDRMLAIYHYSDVTDGINFIGADTLAFQHSPTCFGFRINEYYFFNLSTDYLFSKNLGFPYLSNPTYVRENTEFPSLTSGEFVTGSGKIKSKVLKKDILYTTAQFIQPIFNNRFVVDIEQDIYKNNDYINKNTLSSSEGKGAIFITESGRDYNGISDSSYKISNNFIDLSLGLSLKDWSQRFARMIYDYQLYMLDNHVPSTHLLDEDLKESIQLQFKAAKMYNKTIMDLSANKR